MWQITRKIELKVCLLLEVEDSLSFFFFSHFVPYCRMARVGQINDFYQWQPNCEMLHQTLVHIQAKKSASFFCTHKKVIIIKNKLKI